MRSVRTVISRRNTYSFTAARVFRGIAIVFLLYTGAEVTAPQYCNEAFGLTKTSAASASAATSAAGKKHSQKEQPSERHSSGDEDCFCCCAHVLPADIGGATAAPPAKTFLVEPQKSGLISPPLRSPYHPPRAS